MGGSECIVGRKAELFWNSAKAIWYKWSSQSPANKDDPKNANDLEGLAQVADTAAAYYGGNRKAVIMAVSDFVLGVPGAGPLSVYNAHKGEGSQYIWGDQGFHTDFRDGSPQPRHAWAYIAETSTPGSGFLSALLERIGGIGGQLTGQLTNYYHEFTDSTGGSWNDFILSEAGMYIGWQYTVGAIDPANLGNELRQNLGPNAPDALTGRGKAPANTMEWYLLPGR